MITELESLQPDTESKDDKIRRLEKALHEAMLKIEALTFQLQRKPRREFVAVPWGN